MRTSTRRPTGAHRAYLGILATAGTVATLGAAFATLLAATSAAAPAAAPVNTAEPRITGTARVGQTLTTTRGSWTSISPITYALRWFRCEGRGQPDASDCRRISNARNATYTLRQADAGFRLRSQVVARNLDGTTTATSDPTSVVQGARPTNTREPSISGSAVVGSRLTADRGEWVGNTPITYTFQWLRCNRGGNNCVEIRGATNTTYVVQDGDRGRTLRVRVTARNDAGSESATSNPTGVVGERPTGTLPVEDLEAAGDRLVVAQVRFSPSPVTSPTAPISAQVRVTARGGRPVSGALVFIRATPRVVQGQTRATGGDGWVTLQLVPNQSFPQPRSGRNVQFFVKAYRSNDPPLGGIAGYRLVQVPLAG